MGKAARIFEHPETAIGRTVYILTRNPAPEDCGCSQCLNAPQLKIKTVKIDSVAYYCVDGRKHCLVNGEYEFPLRLVDRMVFFRRYQAWLRMEKMGCM